MSKAAAKISLASTKWQPDSILNRAAYDGSFSENELFAKVQFIEPQPPIFRKPVAAVLGQAPEGESDGLSEKDTSSSTGNDKESAGLAEQVGAKDQSSRSAMPNISPALPILDQDSLRQEYDRGFDAGVQAARAEARKSIELEKHGVREFLVALNESLANPRDFFVPMESLAIHIAEQLVRGELSLSGTAIRRLVENALMEIGRPGQKVTVRLNPDDLDKFSMLDSELSDLMTLVRDSGLSRGSVRLEMSGGAIEDLIENRLDAIARSALGEHAARHLNHRAGNLQTTQQDEISRFQMPPPLDTFSQQVTSQSLNNLETEAFTVDEDEAGPVA